MVRCGRGFGEVWVRLRAHPIALDTGLAVLVGAVALAPYLVDSGSEMFATAPTPAMIGLLAGACALLILRRRFPRSVWVLTTAAGVAVIAISGTPTPIYLPAVVALYTLSVREPAARAVAAGVVSAVVPTVLILLRSAALVDTVAFGAMAWSGLALMSGIAVRAQRRAVATANERARLAEASREDEAQRRVAEDRLRIARELHDVVAHHISAINVQAGVASVLIERDPGAAVAAMAQVRRASQEVLRELPALLGVLRTTEDGVETVPAPRLAEAAGLVDAARLSGLEVVWQSSGARAELPPAVDLTAYRVIQESLTNAARHGTGPVRIRLEQRPDRLTVTVRNALPDAAARPGEGGYGLLGMRERVAAVGGTLRAGLRGATAWEVHASLPVAAHGDNASEETQ